MSLQSPAHQLLPGDVINFGDDLCFVVGTEPPADDGYMTLVTEGFAVHNTWTTSTLPGPLP
jgi:hypothetical protein